MAGAVLFDARLVLPQPTGIGQYVTSLLPELLRQAPETLFHLLRRPDPWPGYGLVELAAPNLRQHVSRLRHMSLRQHWIVPRLALRLKVDLLHYPHFDAPVTYAPVPVVATIHDAKYLVRPDFFTNLGVVKRAYMRFSYRQTLRRAAGVIVDSAATAADLRRLFSVPADQLSVIHLAADPRFRPARPAAVAALRAKYGLERPFILSVGERRPHKNHAGLIRAYADGQSRATHDLVIVGQAYGDYAGPETAVAELGLAGRVRLLEGVPFDELVAFYTAADLFVLVSHYEGFGLPLLEAMGCGVPVVAANSTAMGEIAGDAALLVDPANQEVIAAAIDKVLAEPSVRGRLIAAGAARHAEFSWPRTAAQTLRVYAAVTG